jgi:hypothetical protein
MKTMTVVQLTVEPQRMVNSLRPCHRTTISCTSPSCDKRRTDFGFRPRFLPGGFTAIGAMLALLAADFPALGALAVTFRL